MPPRVPPQTTLSHILFNEESCIDFLIEYGIILQRVDCLNCFGQMTLRRDKKIYRCTTHSCRKEKTIRENSFFANSRLPFKTIMQLGYHWLLRTPSTSIVSATGCSSSTVSAFRAYFRQLVSETLEDEDTTIGGDGIVVELDETKLGKRKYHRGHRVDGLWVLGGIERTAEKRIFLMEVPDRRAETLLSVISAHVAPGSIIMTDLWRGYFNLGLYNNYEHLTVNHSVEFVNDISGCCTNTIEGIWNGVKLRISPRERTSNIAPGCLLEYIWRRKHKQGLWEGLLNALKAIGYPGSL